jgi:hypothetical protein
MDNNILDMNKSKPFLSILTEEKHDRNKSNQIMAILTQNDIKIVLDNSDQTTEPELKFLSKDVNLKNLQRKKPEDLSQTTINLQNPLIKDCENDTVIGFRLPMRSIFFLPTVCQVCKVKVSNYIICPNCLMVSYCKDEHMKIDVVHKVRLNFKLKKNSTF